jgi:HJR/Mrr/RecB family endonuclease
MKSVYISTSLKYVDDFLTFNVKRELEQLGYKILNEEESFYDKSISPEYLINKCDVFIVILKYAEPKLFYEIGYASSLSKNIIIISNLSEEIPHFLKNYTFINVETYSTNIGFQLTQLLGTMKFDINTDLNYPNDLKDFIRTYRENPQILERLTEKEFEQIVFNHFKNNTGFNPEEPVNIRDYGYDMIFSNYLGFSKTLVEIKKYNSNSKVSINVIQQLVGAMLLYQADHGILITTSTFTLSAKDFVASLPYKIELWDLDYLEKMI